MPAEHFVKWLRWLDALPLIPLAIAAVLLGLSPFYESHLWQKFKLIVDGESLRPMDIADVAMHSSLFILLVLKVIRRRYAATDIAPHRQI